MYEIFFGDKKNRRANMKKVEAKRSWNIKLMKLMIERKSGFESRNLSAFHCSSVEIDSTSLLEHKKSMDENPLAFCQSKK